MIFVHDKGRMCNNILQYGHFYAWGREHDRETVSMRFAYKYGGFRICHTKGHHPGNYLLGKFAPKMHLWPLVHFDAPGDIESGERAMMSHRNITVTGWEARWYDLFLKYKQEIVSLFAFDDEVERSVEPMLKTGQTTLGLHVRRGDYATWHGGRFLYSDEQYIGVARRFLKLHPEAHIYVCGNDPQLNRNAFSEALGSQVTFADGTPQEDLCLLSHCQFLIGPPSTFTLVAALYHDRPLCWLKDPEAALTAESFGRFDQLFRNII